MFRSVGPVKADPGPTGSDLEGPQRATLLDHLPLLCFEE